MPVHPTNSNRQRFGSLKPEGKVYPPTKHEVEWSAVLEDHADQIDDAEEGMGDRALHFFRQMRREAARVAEQDAIWTYEDWAPFCESEIEKLFLMALIFQCRAQTSIVMPDPSLWSEDPYAFMTTKMVDYLGGEISGRDPQLTGILMQVPIHGYRADFVLYGISAYCDDKSTWLKFPLVVECDGHDFHDRTKEQAKRDRKRDRMLASHGYQSVRFTGSEIWRDPHTCVNEALAVIERHQNEHYLNAVTKGGHS